MFDAAVEVGVAAFLAGDVAPSDDEVIERLQSQGVAGWLAQRLVFFLPIAFGRRVLPGVEVSGGYDDGGGGATLRRLDADPLYAAASRRALIATRAEVERVGLRSAEVSGVNEALFGGSQLEDLVIGPVRASSPLPPAEAGDGGVPEPRQLLADILTQHGLTVEGDRVGELHFDARLFAHPAPQGVLPQIDVILRHPALAVDPLVESLAAWDTTWAGAIGQNLARFAAADLHPIMAGLLGADGGHSVDRWPVEHPDGAFELVAGPVLTWFAPSGPGVGAFLGPLLDALKSQPLTPAVHGLRVFLQHTDGVLTANEVLLDNEPWPAGLAVVAATTFGDLPPLVATRWFALLVAS